MRIIGGKFRSRRIQVPAKLKARPTTDFAREGLFNVLNNIIDWEETVALDLFSGTGSIALEMVSRGSPKVVCVESENLHWRFICKTKDELNATELYPLKADVFKFINSCREQFDLIFADPPYDMKNIGSLPSLIIENNLLKPDGLLILEHSKKLNFSLFPHFVKERVYGNVHYSFFKLEN